MVNQPGLHPGESVLREISRPISPACRSISPQGPPEEPCALRPLDHHHVAPVHVVFQHEQEILQSLAYMIDVQMSSLAW
jgi:hypothetical protein